MPNARRADIIVQLANLALAAAGCAVLAAIALQHPDPLHRTSLAIYALAMLAMFASSALYGIGRDGPWHHRFRHLDHAGIFLMIAGTYTPFTLILIGGATGAWLCGFVWTVALLGLALKFAAPDRFERLAIPLYLLLGWTIAARPGALLAMAPSALALLVAGGILYTAGIAFHLTERLRYGEAIWHGFVAAAATCHYAAILQAVALA